ncbi:uncharacterized protein LOC107808027 isoform X2 [Nicotiana tabacum]|uniref:Uncharacterized protein LOC107808027 isoform X2 n=1 Tax=Nicotiana tabacum TaxID=4097 RepID=A0AC58SAJ9_TOBAC
MKLCILLNQFRRIIGLQLPMMISTTQKKAVMIFKMARGKGRRWISLNWNSNQIMPIAHCGLVLMEEFSLRPSLHYINKPMIFSLPLLSLFAAVSVGLETETIIAVLNKLSKTKLPKEMIDFIHASTANYGKVKLVLKNNRYFGRISIS